MPLLQASLPYCSTDKVFSAIFFSFSQLVTGWRDGRISFYCAPHFSPAHPRRAFRLTPSHFRGVAKAALYCAHRTSTFLSCAFCEQEGHLAAPFHPS